MSGSRDKTIKLWNTLGDCKYTIAEPDGHTEWVSCVRFSPVTTMPTIVSAGWDKLVKVRCRLLVWLPRSPYLPLRAVTCPAARFEDAVHCPRSARSCEGPVIPEPHWQLSTAVLPQVWNLTNCKLRANLASHEGYINTVTVSPDGSLCASGGKVSSLLLASCCAGSWHRALALLSSTGAVCCL